MTNPELVEFIKKRLNEGVDIEQFKSELIKVGGWSEADVNEGLAYINSQKGQNFQGTKSNINLPKLVWITLGLILIGIIGGGVYFLYVKGGDGVQKTIDSESEILEDDNTFVQNKLTPNDWGFSITLPIGWSTEPRVVNNDTAVVSFLYESPDKENTFKVLIFDGINPESTTFAEWTKNHISTYDKNTVEDPLAKIGVNLGSIYTGNINGTRYKRAYLLRGNEQQIYLITTETESNNWLANFDDILSSFAFIESKSSEYKVYKNTQFAFELSYPSSWRVRENGDGITIRNYYNSILDKPVTPIDIEVTYMKDKNPSELSLEEWLKIDFNNIFVRNEISREKVNLGDEAIRSVRTAYTDTPGKSPVSYLIKRGTDIIQVTYLSEDSSVYVHNPDQIISTLKFVEFNQDQYKDLVQKETEEVVGADVNNDGVWDYVESWIDGKSGTNKNLRTALRLMAKETQFEILNYRDKEAIIQHSHETFGYYCLRKVDKELALQISDELIAEMLNTKERITAYFTADGQLGGQAYGSPDEDVVTQYCGF